MELIELAVKELDRLLCEQPKLNQLETGLNFTVYVSPEMASHGPRIKISNKVDDGILFDSKHESIPIAVSKDEDPFIPNGITSAHIPKNRIKDAIKWAKINKDAIHEYWYNGNKDSSLDDFKLKLKDLNGKQIHKDHVTSDSGNSAKIKIQHSKQKW